MLLKSSKRIVESYSENIKPDNNKYFGLINWMSVQHTKITCSKLQ